MAIESTTKPEGADAFLAPPPSNRPEEGQAAVIFKGAVSLWIGWQALAGAGSATLAGLAALLYGLFQPAGVVKQGLVIGGGALFAAGALMVPYLFFAIRTLRYTITTRLIEREKGIFIKRVDSLDLARVKDVELTQSLLQRVCRIGTIEVYSSDRTDPVMRIEAIPNPRPVYERLRDAVIQISQRRGIIPMDH